MRTGWTEVCSSDRIRAGSGVAVLVDDRQLAVIRADDGTLHAIDNRDPWSGACVLSRGIVGEWDGVATIASPLRKQRFVLATGHCLDGDESVAVHTVEESAGRVRVLVHPVGTASP